MASSRQESLSPGGEARRVDIDALFSVGVGLHASPLYAWRFRAAASLSRCVVKAKCGGNNALSEEAREEGAMQVGDTLAKPSWRRELWGWVGGGFYNRTRRRGAQRLGWIFCLCVRLPGPPSLVAWTPRRCTGGNDERCVRQIDPQGGSLHYVSLLRPLALTAVPRAVLSVPAALKGHLQCANIVTTYLKIPTNAYMLKYRAWLLGLLLSLKGYMGVKLLLFRVMKASMEEGMTVVGRSESQKALTSNAYYATQLLSLVRNDIVDCSTVFL